MQGLIFDPGKAFTCRRAPNILELTLSQNNIDINKDKQPCSQPLKSLHFHLTPPNCFLGCIAADATVSRGSNLNSRRAQEQYKSDQAGKNNDSYAYP